MRTFYVFSCHYNFFGDLHILFYLLRWRFSVGFILHMASLGPVRDGVYRCLVCTRLWTLDEK